MKKAIQRYCRKHYKGVLKTISILEFISRILAMVAFLVVIVLPSGWDYSDRPLWQFVVYEGIAMFFARLFYQVGYSDYYEED